MPNVVRFVLDSARNLHVPGVGNFIDGILDVDANNIVVVSRTRYLVQPYRAIEIGVVDSETPPPDLPPAPEDIVTIPDPYAQYLLPSELPTTFNEAVESGDIVLPGGSAASVNAADYGLRTSASGAVNTAALVAAVAEMTAAGGGVLTIPPGVYDANLSLVGTNLPFLVEAWGATFRAYANGQTVLAVSQSDGNMGDGPTHAGCYVVGLNIDGNGKTSVIGADIYDTDGAFLTLPLVRACATGVRFRATAAPATSWVERCGLSASYIIGCSVGIDFTPPVGFAASFNEIVLRDVGVSNCGIGIAQRKDANFARVTWDNVTVWLSASGQTGVLFDGMLDFSHLTFGLESFTATSTTGIAVGANYHGFADPWAHTIEVSFVGPFGNKFTDASTDGLTYRDGLNMRTTKFGAYGFFYRGSETSPRMAFNSAGIALGGGSSWPTATLGWATGDRLNWPGRFAPGGGVVLKAPNGSEFLLTVGNDGALTTTAL